jgi:prolyl oligopeptidase
MRIALVAMLLATVLAPAAPAAAPAGGSDLWLESVAGEKALAWVARQNRVTTRELAGTAEFKFLTGRFMEVLNSSARIPFVTKIGDRYYNFWRDRQHEHGLWRRTTLDEYRKGSPAWETVLDLDSLSKAEKESWVWAGASPLEPDYTRCLVSLSRGGADASVTREFDLQSASFVPGGFNVPESKSSVAWIDRDRMYVAPALDSTTMTTSGYPRVVKEWKRGTPLSEATLVYEGQAGDVGVGGYHDFTPGFERDFVQRSITIYTSELFLRRDGRLIKIETPDDASPGVWREWLLVQPRTDWNVGGHRYAAGALLAARLEDFLAGKRDFDLLFEPTERKSLSGYSTTRHAILVTELDNVRSRVYVVQPTDSGWTRTPLPGLPEFASISATGVDDHLSDDYWLTVTDFLTPTSLCLGAVGGGPAEKLKQTPMFFDAGRLEVSQHEAVSKDGTRVPYFQVAPKNLKVDGSAVTLLTGYGGFEVSELPYYSGVRGRGWLERGGVLVLANIRGGGEFGPKWHQGALKDKRHRAYEDFIAVAEDLVRRKVTAPRHLGCMGGSNGGLLVGNMLTMRPDLFGAIVCQSPLLDMRRYHKLLAGASWMSEYGDPDDPKDWKFIRTFSPYENVVKSAKYPRTLFTSSTRDDRVHPSHARRMVAKMKAQGHDVLYYENVEGGHAGAANNKQQAFMSALEFTFLWKQLGGSGHPGAGPARGGRSRE